MDMREFKQQFDKIFSTYVESKINDSKILIEHPRIGKFLEHLYQLSKNWWYRLRPYLLYLSYSAFGWTKIDEIMRFGIIFELIYTADIVIDDLMDNADKRHSMMTIHNFIRSSITKENNFAEKQTTLLSNLIITWIYELLEQEHPFDKETLKWAKRNVRKMVEDFIIWEMLDVDVTLEDRIEDSILHKKNLYKSANSIFMRPLVTWAILANAPDKQRKLISDMWKHLGMAFQIKDDLKDILANHKDKSVFTDIKEWQHTYFTQYVFINGTYDERLFLKNCLWRTLDNATIARLQLMFHHTWAIDFGKELIEEHLEQASKDLEVLKLKDDSIYQKFFAVIQNIWSPLV